MKLDPETKAQIKVGSVVQVDPGIDLEELRGALLVVDRVESWGVIGFTVDRKSGDFQRHWVQHRVSWNHVETTGGAAVWNEKGERTRETAAPLRHHP